MKKIENNLPGLELYIQTISDCQDYDFKTITFLPITVSNKVAAKMLTATDLNWVIIE